MSYEVVKLKYLSQVPITNGLGLPGEHDNPEWPRYIRTTDIASPTSLRDDVFASQPPDVASKARVSSGDILMSAAGSIGKSVRLTGVGDACYAGFLVRYRPNNRVDGRFVAYWMQSQHYWDQISVGAVRSTIDNFSASKYREMQVPLPPVEEQRRIADFLDDQVARIGQTVSARNRQLEVLSRLPSERVRHDLEFVAKDHEPVSLRRVLRAIVIGSTPSEDLSVADGGLEWFTPASIDADGRLQDPVRYIDAQAAQAAGLRHFPAPSVLLVGIGATAGKVSRLDKPASGNQQLSCLVPGPQIDRDYLYFALRALKDTVLGTAPFTTLPILNNDTVGSIRVPLPAPDSQAHLVAVWERQEAEVGLVKGTVLSQIGLLEERKRALITAAVTGEFDVTTAKPIGMGKWVPNVGAGVDTPAAAEASSIRGIG